MICSIFLDMFHVKRGVFMATTNYDYSDDVLPPGDNLLATISHLANEQKKAEEAVVAAEAAVDVAKAALREISWRRLPELMAEAGQTQCTTANGLVVKVEDHLRASIPEARAEEAFAWLTGHEMESVIKSQMTLIFGRGEAAAERLQKIFDFVESLGEVEVAVKKSVHPSTLKSTLNQCLKEGVEVPMDVFGAVVQRETTVKPVKKKV